MKLVIPLTPLIDNIPFTTLTDLEIATGYNRVVVGARGPYIEFRKEQMIFENIHIPNEEIWRINSSNAFYIEYRSNDESNVKIYLQKKTVSYADYKIDFFYISPLELKSPLFKKLINDKTN